MGSHSYVHRVSGKHFCDPDIIGLNCKLLPSGRGQHVMSKCYIWIAWKSHQCTEQPVPANAKQMILFRICL